MNDVCALIAENFFFFIKKIVRIKIHQPLNIFKMLNFCFLLIISILGMHNASLEKPVEVPEMGI